MRKTSLDVTPFWYRASAILCAFASIFAFLISAARSCGLFNSPLALYIERGASGVAGVLRAIPASIWARLGVVGAAVADPEAGDAETSGAGEGVQSSIVGTFVGG